MRLAILGKLICLNTVTITISILIISLISWYNSSSYVFLRLNSRFTTLAVTKSQQLDEYLLYTFNSAHSIVSRVLLQNATANFLHDKPISLALNQTVQRELRNGARTTLDMLSVRIVALKPTGMTWETIFQSTPDTVEAKHFAPLAFNLLPNPPVEGMINPFTLSGGKYVFIITRPMLKSKKDSYIQIIFDATRILQLTNQVTNTAEANIEYILVAALSDPSKFQVLFPTLYHPQYGQQIYDTSSDKSVQALLASPKPTSTRYGIIANYTFGIMYDFHNFAGQRVTAGYARLYSGSSHGWGLLVQAPQDQVQKPLYRLRNLLLIAAISSLVLLLLILMPILWYCAKPVRNLRSVTAAAHEAPIDVEGLSKSKRRKLLGCVPTHFLEDEVTDIKESFIALAESLNEQYRNLDEKVASRTMELVAAQQEAVAANTAKSSFLSTMSHEIRSPLQGIIALADVNLLEDQNVSDEIRQTLNTIKESGDHLLYLISDILDFSKIEAGHLILEERGFSLGKDLINQLRIGFRPKATALGLTFTILTDPPELYQFRIQSDKHRLYQILQNLLSNAFKFTITGSVTFKIYNLQSNIFQFIVQDTGTGIPAKVIPNLFQPFTQADASYSRKFGGTGLGLAVSRQLATLMGGEITVTSEENVGSIFTFTVPLTVAGASDSPFATEAPPFTPTADSKNSPLSLLSRTSRISVAHSVRNVLVADDNEVNRKVLTKMLQRCGIQNITLAENGVEALQFAQQRTFDLILMDLAMPCKTGFEATRQLREEKYEGMIVALTAHIGVEEQEKALDSGANHVLTKPITLKELEEFLHGISK